MAQPPAKNPSPGSAAPPKPSGPLGHAGKDKLESSERNLFSGGRKFDFQPTPLKPQTTEVSTPGMRVPPRVGAGAGNSSVGLPPVASSSPPSSSGNKPPPQMAAPKLPSQTSGTRPPPQTSGPKLPPQTSGPKLPPQTSGPKLPPQTSGPKPPQQNSGSSTSPPGQRRENSSAFLMPGMPGPGEASGAPAKKPLNLAQGSSAVAARPMAKGTNPGTMPAARPAAKPAAPKAPPAQSMGLITSGDQLQYQGKLPVFVGKAIDGNPMIDAEDAVFVFDPAGKRVQIQCKVASIMLKAACLHLGIPAPDRGPRRFILNALLRPEVVTRHHAQLFDGNLEVRLTALDEGRPVLLDLTLYETFNVHPDG